MTGEMADWIIENGITDVENDGPEQEDDEDQMYYEFGILG